MSFRSALAVSVALATLASGAAAQTTPTEPTTGARSTTQGFFAGAAFSRAMVDLADEDVDSDPELGSGLTLTAGYGFTPQIGLLVVLSGANIKDGVGGEYTFAQVDIAARYSFANRSRNLVPYAELAFGGIGIGDTDATFSGPGFTGGVGLNFFLNRHAAVDVAVRAAHGEFTTITSDGESLTDNDGVGVNTLRIDVGLSFFPGSR